MNRSIQHLLIHVSLWVASAAWAVDGPDCSRPMTLALHDHGLLYSSTTGAGIDKDFSDEMIRRSGCKMTVSVLISSVPNNASVTQASWIRCMKFWP